MHKDSTNHQESKLILYLCSMENNANNQNISPEGKPQPIRWGYVVAAIIVIAIVILAEMFHPRSTRNQLKAYDALIEAAEAQNE